jgi:hypothetical protein
MAKSKKSRSKPARDLPAGKVAGKHARNVRGGAYQAYLNVKSTKQGKFKGEGIQN